MTTFNKFGDLLLHKRSAAGLTRKQLSGLTGISTTQIARYEGNQSEPTLSALIKLSNALNVSMLELIPSEEITQQNIGKHIVKYLDFYDILPAKLANALGIRSKLLCEIIDGKKIPSQDIIKKLSLLFKIDLNKEILRDNTIKAQNINVSDNNYTQQSKVKMSLNVIKGENNNLIINDNFTFEDEPELITNIKKAFLAYASDHADDYEGLEQNITDLDLTSLNIIFSK